MAIITTTICSSSTTMFPTIPSIKSPSSLQSQLSSSPPSCRRKFGSTSITHETLEIEPVPTLASVGKEDLPLIFENGREVWSYGENRNGMESDRERNGDLRLRRKKRRRRRRKRNHHSSEEEENEERDIDQFKKVLFVPMKSSGVLSPTEEAEFCMCLKHQARIEAARRRLGGAQEVEPTSMQLAKALRMNKKTVDKILCKGREAQERIACSYRRLVVSIATCYQGKGLSLQDLIQEGSIGLLRGAKRFDPQKGYKLSTYVYWWIKEAILTAISNKSRIVRLPRKTWAMVAKITEANNDLRNRLRRAPSYDEIAEVLNMEVSTVWLGFERSRFPISLDQPVLGQDGMTLQEITTGPDETMPETLVKKQLMKQELEKHLQKVLTAREAHILRLHFGLNGQTPQSREEIGRILNLSRERIRQIICIALSKLRETSLKDILKVDIV